MCSGNGNGGFSSAGGGWKGLGVTPICQCGDVVVIRTARTTRNAGKKFWGCPNFKVSCVSVTTDFFFKLLIVIIVVWFFSSFHEQRENQ